MTETNYDLVAQMIGKEVQEEQVDLAKTSFANSLASGEDPVKASERLRRARNLGVDPQTLDEVPPTEYFQKETSAVDWNKMRIEAPKTLELVQNEATVNVVKGDVTSLMSLEGWKQMLAWKAGGDTETQSDEAGVGNAFARGVSIGAVAGPSGAGSDAFAAHKDLKAIRERKARLDEGEAPEKVFEGSSDPELASKLFLSGYEAKEQYLKRIIKERAELIANYQHRISLLAESEGAKKFAKAETAGEAIKAYWEDPGALVEQGVQSLAMMLPQLALASVAPGVIGAGIVGLGSGTTELNSTFMDGLGTQVDLKDADALANFMLDPNNADYLSKLEDEATKKGMVVGAFDALSVGLVKPLEAGLNKVLTSKGTGSTILKGLTQLEAQGAMGGLGEGLSQVHAYGSVTSWKDVVAEVAGEHFTGPVEIMGALREEHMKLLKEKIQARRNQEALQAIGTIVAGMNNPDPTVLQHVFNGDSKQKTIKITIDIEGLAQSTPEALEAMRANPELSDRINESLAQGKPLEMTLGEYASHVAPIDQGTGSVATHTSVGDAPSQAEIEARGESLYQETGKILNEQMKAEAREERTRIQAELKEIREDIQQQLSHMEGVSVDEAKGLSVLWASMVNTLSADLGISAKEIWQNNRLEFKSFTPDENGIRGLYNDALRTIFKTPTVDRSTLLHESGHAYLEMRNRVLDSLYERQKRGEDLNEKEQYLLDGNNEILKWLGYDHDTWSKATIGEKRKAHEKFAESFEIYLMKGEAPVKSLRNVFQKFKSWLKAIYLGMKVGQHGELNPEVQQLFNGLFLSSELAQQFKIRNADLLDTSYINRSTTEGEVTDHIVAVDDQAQIMAAVEDRIQAAYTRLARRLRKQKKISIKKLRAKARDVFQSSKTYKAIQALKGQVEGVTMTPTRDLLKEMGYGDGQIKRLTDARLAKVRASVNTVNDVATLEAYASALGYESAQEMMDDIFANLNQKAAVDRLAEQLWDKEQKEQELEALLRDTSVEEAVFNSDLLDSARGVLTAFERLSSSVKENAGEGITLAAKAWVDTTPLRDHNLKTIAKNARMNASRARKAFMHGDVMQAIAYQKKALYFLEVGEAVRQARKDAVRYRKTCIRCAKLKNPKMSGRYLELLHRVLVAIGYGDEKRYHLNHSDEPISTHLKELGFLFSEEFLARLDNEECVTHNETVEGGKWEPGPKGKAYYDKHAIKMEDRANFEMGEDQVFDHNLQVYNEAIKEDGYYVFPGLDSDTPEGIRMMTELLNAIEQQGYEYKKILDGKDKVEVEEAMGAMESAVLESAKEKGKEIRREFEDMSGWSRVKNGVIGFFTMHLRLNVVLNRMVKDGNDAFKRFVLYPADKCNTYEETWKIDTLKRLEAPMKVLSGAFRSAKRVAGHVLSCQEAVALLLNMGNEGNLIRAIVTYANRAGLQLSETDNGKIEQAMLKEIGELLTKEEVEAVQKVWDVFDHVQKETAEVTRRMDKKTPEWVEKRALKLNVEGREIELQGGYYPIRYDRLASRQNVKADINDALEGISVFAKGGVNEGHLKARISSVPTDMYLSLTDRAMYEGLEQQLHYNAWAEFLKRQTQIFEPNSPLSKTIRQYWGKAAVDYIQDWLRGIASQEPPKGGEKLASFLRQNVSLAGVGFNLVTAAVQMVGFAQSVAAVGGWRAISAMGSYIVNKGPFGTQSKFIREKSPFMANRMHTQNKELRELHSFYAGGLGMVGKAVRAQRWTAKKAFIFVAFMQRVVDEPTWMAAYEKALAEGKMEADAIAEADRTVIETQGSGRATDLSQIEKGGAFAQLFTVFYTFFNTTFNLLTLAGYQKNKYEIARYLFIIAIMQPIAEGFLREGIKDLAGTDDKEPWWKRASNPAYMASKVANFNLGYFVGIREFAGLSDLIEGKPVRGYNGPGGLRKVGDIYALSNKIPKIAEGDIDMGVMRSIVRTVGPLAGLPTVAVDRILQAEEARRKGKSVNPLTYGFGYSKGH